MLSPIGKLLTLGQFGIRPTLQSAASASLAFRPGPEIFTSLQPLFSKRSTILRWLRAVAGLGCALSKPLEQIQRQRKAIVAARHNNQRPPSELYR
jgi:hypothetical protein